MYTPPFVISTEAINLIASISAQIERYSLRLEQGDNLRLRKANRIKTIHSSLAIEGNTLTENEVKEILDGKNVVAPVRQVQEVRNAVRTYELFSTLNPFEEKDLLRAHGVMMEALVDDTGQSGPFIDFMLNEIYKTLKAHQGKEISLELPNKFPNKLPNKWKQRFPDLDEIAWQVLTLLTENPSASSEQLALKMNLSARQIRTYIGRLRDMGIIVREGSNKKGLWVLNVVL